MRGRNYQSGRVNSNNSWSWWRGSRCSPTDSDNHNQRRYCRLSPAIIKGKYPVLVYFLVWECLGSLSAPFPAVFTCSLGDFFSIGCFWNSLTTTLSTALGWCHCGPFTVRPVYRISSLYIAAAAACIQKQQPVYRSSSLYTESAAFPRVPNVLKAVRDLKPEGTEF